MKPTHYQITVRGLLSASMASAFDGLTARPSATGTVLCGEIADQSALYGVLERIESLGLELVAVHPTASAR